MTNIRKILLVDDEEDIRVIAHLSLQEIGGWETLLAVSGAEAIEQTGRELPELFDPMQFPHQVQSVLDAGAST